MISLDDIVLFQGDSITDCQRDPAIGEPNVPEALGLGYARYATAMLLADFPQVPGLRVFNRGVGGDTVWRLEERWKTDCLDLVPSVLSVLVGINDAAQAVEGNPDASIDRYEALYRKLLDDTRAINPAVRFVLCEPFALPCGNVTDAWLPHVDGRRAIVERLAGDYGAAFVPFQQLFNDAAASSGPEYWAPDGVHPTLAGHMLMARAWLGIVRG